MFRKIVCSIVLSAGPNLALADDITTPATCAFWTSAIPQSMALDTNACPRISRSVSLDAFRIEPYRYLNAPGSRFQSDTPILAGGAVLNSTLNILPGKPVVALDIGSRTQAARWNPARDPIWATSISLGYQVNMRLELGPHITQTWDTAGERITRHRTYGLYLKWRF
ncbi:MAG: hypothetical protein WAV50_00785 [Minisyncoccia bacterium]